MKKSKNKRNSNKKDLIIKFISSKKRIILMIVLLIINIVISIWCAKGNYVNYASLDGKDILISDTKYLVFGRNYVGLIITLFVFCYSVLIDRFIFKNKINKKILVSWFVSLFLLNILLFSLFTNKIY